MVLYKRTLLVIECKTTKITKNFRDVEKSYTRISTDFNESIQAGYNQARNLKELILSQEKTTLYNKKSDLVLEILRDEIDNIECICITKENEGFLATNLSLLLRKEDGEDYPYCINLNDLTQLSEFKSSIKITPQKFLSFLKHRKKLHGKVISDDELNFWGYYLQNGDFGDLIRTQSDFIQLDLSYSKIFDEAYVQKTYLGKVSGKTVKPVSKKLGRNDRCSCNSGKKYKKCCL